MVRVLRTSAEQRHDLAKDHHPSENAAGVRRGQVRAEDVG